MTPAPTGSREATRGLFAMSRPIAGTLVQSYLRKRGITALDGTGSRSGVMVFPDTGIQENLADKARKLGIPVWRFE